MSKKARTVGAVHTHTHNVPLLQKKINHLTVNGKNILVLAMFLLLCLFSNSIQARSEMPEDLIVEKDNTINEMILKASEGIVLSGPRTTTTTSIPLSWTAVNGVTKYNVYQSKNGASYTKLPSVNGTSVTLNTNNAKIKDEAVPDAPKVTATMTADSAGNDLTITASNDNGTIYKHYIEADMTNSTSGYLVFMVDYGKKNSGFVSNAKTAMKVIGRKLIAQGIQIGIVVNGGDSETASWGFTKDVTTFEKNIDSMYRISHGSMARRYASCEKYVK